MVNDVEKGHREETLYTLCLSKKRSEIYALKNCATHLFPSGGTTCQKPSRFLFWQENNLLCWFERIAPVLTPFESTGGGQWGNVLAAIPDWL